MYLNKKKLCLAGIGNDGVLNTFIDYVGANGRRETSVAVAGLITSKTGDEHVRWIKRRKLRTGDEIKIKVLKGESADKPKQRHRYDPVEELRAQKRYVREMAKRLGWQITTKIS